jgi:hypothetical protein
MLIGGAGGKSIYVDGSFGDEYHAFTGQGGGCVWKNNISVTPGQSIAVVVGAEGAQKTAVFPDSFTANNGGVSYFSSVAYLRAHGGEGGSGISGAYGDGGGYGGTVHTGGSGTSGGFASTSETANIPGGGGGAGPLGNGGNASGTGPESGGALGAGNPGYGCADYFPAGANCGYAKIIWGKNRSWPSTNIGDV